MQTKKALVFGASGFIGSLLLEELFNNNLYDTVTVVVRKPLTITHVKLKTLIADYNTLTNVKQQLVGDDVFIALGTTRKNTPDEKLYYQVDHDYPVLAATLAKQNGAKQVCLVSAVGPSLDSKIFYIRTKAEAERDVTAIGFDQTHIFRPSMLMGNRTNEHRPMEKFFIGLFTIVNPLLVGSLKKFRGVQGRDVARAMIAAANTQSLKVNVYEWAEIRRLSSLPSTTR